MSKPVRVQLSRKKGWRMPPNTVKVDRTSRFGNPYAVGSIDPDKRGRNYVMTKPSELVTAFRNYTYRCIELNPQFLYELRGKNLARWCPIISHGEYVPCHADVLLSIANDIPMEEIINENVRRAKREAGK